MSISIEHARRMATSLGRAPFPNIVARAKAKQVLKDVHESAEHFPNFGEDLDKLATFAAYRMLSAGCSFIEQEQFAEGYEQLNSAGDLLESIHRVTDQSETGSGFHCLLGSMAFYACGHYSRGFVLIKAIEPKTPIAAALASFLKRDTKQLVARISEILLAQRDDKWHRDSHGSAITVIIARALACVLEYSVTGDIDYLTSARSALQDAQIISDGSNDPTYWWIARILKLILDDYNRRSLWNLLPPFFGPDTGQQLEAYVRLLALSEPPVVDLWKSQVECLSLALDTSNRGGVVNLRTSAGKTRVAELAILRTLSADQSAKVIYLAPFRSLAFELERTFGKFLGSLGYSVSHLYGGSRFNGIDRAMVDEARLLIATPEKVKALLRAAPEILNDVKLVIVDEGHLLGENERNVKNELFFEHLRIFCQQNGARMLLLSAVLPNADELAAWIGGNNQALAKSNWKPSDERFGVLRWSKRGVQIEWRGSERCFNPHFVEFRKVIDSKSKERKFPKDKKEAVAATAVRLAELGPVLIFAGQARLVPYMADAVILALGDNPAEHRWPALEWRIFKAVCDEELGPDSLVFSSARLGVVCHSNSLPPQVRMALEKLMASCSPRIIIATMTLGQGVNIGISSVIVNQTMINQGVWISKRDFWNICGRAGRAFVDSEGKVLFAIDTTRKAWEIEADENRAAEYLDVANLGRVESGLLSVVQIVKHLAEQAGISFAVLLELVSNGGIDKWGEHEDDVRQLLDMIDDQLLALHLTLNEEPDASDTADWIEHAFRGSLGAIQERLRKDDETFDILLPFLSARVTGILREVPKASRKAIVASGLPLSVATAAHRDLNHLRAIVDAFIHAGGGEEALLAMIGQIESWARVNALPIIRSMPTEELLSKVRPLWIGGVSFQQIISDCGPEAQSICTLFYGYAFTWLCHAIAQKFDRESEEERITALSNAALSLEIGLPTEAAIKVFLAGVRSRVAAMELSIFVVDPSAPISAIRTALLRREMRDALAPLISETTSEWLNMISIEHGQEASNAAYVQPFTLKAPPDVSTLHVRTLGGQLYLCSTDGRFKQLVDSTDDFPFALVANDIRYVFTRTVDVWYLQCRDPRLAVAFDEPLDF